MLASLLLSTLAFLQPATQSAIHHDVIDPTITYQTIDNFGASDAWSMQFVGKWKDENRNKVAELLFSKDKGIGLSCWRFNLGGGLQQTSIDDRFRTAETFETAPGQYDWSRQAGEQWMLRQSARHGVEQRLAFVNSAPGRMTRSGLTNSAGREGPTNFRDGSEPDFARYLADVLQHFSAEGLPFDYLSPINEPQVDWSSGQEGCRMDNVTIAKVNAAVAAELEKRDIPTRIVGPESSNTTDMARLSARPTTRWGYAFGDYIEVLTADDAYARASGKRLCHHIYNAFEGPALFREARDLGERMSHHPDWKIWMSEICILHAKRDLGMDSALTLARMMHATLAVENASAFQWWLALSPYDYKDGLLYTTWKKDGDAEEVTESKMLWAFGNYSRFIRPNWKRVELKGEGHSETGLMASAYLDPTGKRLAVVYVNTLPSPFPVDLQLKSGPLKSDHAWITSATQNLAEMPRAGEGYLIPAHSVVTITADRE